MGPSILTVVAPAETFDLTTLETAKDELGISANDDATNARLTRWIAEASGFVADYCDRVFARETVTETWRTDGFQGRWHGDPRDPEAGFLRLARRPVAEILAASVDGIALTADDYELDAARGRLWRLSGECRIPWWGGSVAVTYAAGYALLADIPFPLETACLEILKHRLAARDRDPMLRSQTIPGELEQAWWVPGAGEDGVPPNIRTLLQPYREYRA